MFKYLFDIFIRFHANQNVIGSTCTVLKFREKAKLGTDVHWRKVKQMSFRRTCESKMTEEQLNGLYNPC